MEHVGLKGSIQAIVSHCHAGRSRDVRSVRSRGCRREFELTPAVSVSMLGYRGPEGEGDSVSGCDLMDGGERRSPNRPWMIDGSGTREIR